MIPAGPEDEDIVDEEDEVANVKFDYDCSGGFGGDGAGGDGACASASAICSV